MCASAYSLFLRAFGPEILSFWSRKSSWDPPFKKGRLGFYEILPAPGKSPRVWFHAASVGEATGAVPTLLALRERLPGSCLFLTSGTPQGLRFARGRLPSDVGVYPFPLDFPESVGRAVRTLAPDLFVAFETEFWPNFYRRLAEAGTPALLLNGRVSESSERFYRIFSPFFRPVFERFERMAMGSEEDAKRAARMGVPAGKILVVGSSKYDGLAERADARRADFWKNILNVEGNGPVLVGGSLRGSECVGIMDVFGRLRAASPTLVGIFAPRHLRNLPRMRAWLDARQIPYHLLSDLETGADARTRPAVLVDRIGVLFELYSTGDLIFCGGTIEPVGGHNILEPAAWGKAVFYGPCLKKVRHEHTILHSLGGSFPVRDTGDLLGLWAKWIENPGGLARHGEGAKRALDTLGGVVDRQVDLILESLFEREYDAKAGTGTAGV